LILHSFNTFGMCFGGFRSLQIPLLPKNFPPTTIEQWQIFEQFINYLLVSYGNIIQLFQRVLFENVGEFASFVVKIQTSVLQDWKPVCYQLGHNDYSNLKILLNCKLSMHFLLTFVSNKICFSKNWNLSIYFQ
jgi:hypothetical protein